MFGNIWLLQSYNTTMLVLRKAEPRLLCICFVKRLQWMQQSSAGSTYRRLSCLGPTQSKNTPTLGPTNKMTTGKCMKKSTENNLQNV